MQSDVSDGKPDVKDALAELRRLLVGPERQEIAQIREDMAQIGAVSAEEVGSVLPQAVRHSSRAAGAQIDEALVPVVEDCVGLSAKRNPTRLGDLLFPVMGPAIRKAVREAINSMIEAFNQTIDHSISPRALVWRVEALTSGKSYSEVVFLHTMLFKVEQVFLIHRETGLLLQHASATGLPPVKDADVVSGMLTAIQDFVRDSFKTKEGDALDRMTVGDLTVVIEPGPTASVAGVVRGHAPEDLRYVFHEALNEIHREQADDLRRFDGDVSVFLPTRSHLEGCLQFRVNPSVAQAKAHRTIWHRLFTPFNVLAGLVLAVLLGAGYLYYQSSARWGAYLDRLRHEPGIVVTESTHRWWRTSSVEGLRDPFARDPRALLTERQIDPSDVDSQWKPFHSMEPPFVLRRAQAVLTPPDTVSMQMGADGTLEAIGSAPRQWIADARRLALVVPGVIRFKDDRLTDTDLEKLQHLREQVQGYNILFPTGEASPLPASRQTLAALAADITRLARDGARIGYLVEVEVRGHTDSSGAELVNRELSQLRADYVLDRLRATLPAGVKLTPKGVASGSPLRPEVTEADRAWNRRVAAIVTLRSRDTGQEAAQEARQRAALDQDVAGPRLPATSASGALVPLSAGR